jgi:Na+/melibiose symporter-like transporter
VVLLSVPVAAWDGALTLGELFAVALLAGTSSAFFSPAYGVYLPSLIPNNDLDEGNAKLQGNRSAARLAGPGATGLLAQLFGSAAGLLADAGTFVVSAACLLAIEGREDLARATGERTCLRTEIGAGLRLVAGDPYFRVLIGYGAVVNLALSGWQSLEVVFLVRVVGVTSGTVGVVVAVIGVGGVCGALAARRVAHLLGTGHGFVICALATAPFALLAWTPTLGPPPNTTELPLSRTRA